MSKVMIVDADGRVAGVSAQGSLAINASGTTTLTTGTDPAAGVEVSQTVPAGETWELVSVHVNLVTSAVAATRRVVLTVDDGSTVFLKIPANATQAASLTYAYSFQAGLGYANGTVLDLNVTTGLPRIVVPAGYRIRTATVAIDAGDNFGAPLIAYVKR